MSKIKQVLCNPPIGFLIVKTNAGMLAVRMVSIGHNIRNATGVDHMEQPRLLRFTNNSQSFDPTR